MRLKKPHILRASGVTKGIVSVRKAWSMPMFTNRMAQPRVKSNLKMFSSGNTIAAQKAGLRTGKKVGR